MAKKRKRPTASAAGPADTKQKTPTCTVEGCGQPTWPGSKFCAAHSLTDRAIAFAERAMSKGNVLQALLGQVGVAAAPVVHNVMARANEYMNGQMAAEARSGARRPAGPPPPKGGMTPREAFAVLGLDPKRATAEDVRKRQQALARIFHPDAAAPATDPEMQARVNAAADIATEWVKKKA